PSSGCAAMIRNSSSAGPASSKNPAASTSTSTAARPILPSSFHGQDGLLDYLVGLRKQDRRHGKPERFRSYEVDDQLELGRSLDRQIGRFGPLEDLVGKAGGAPKKVVQVRSVGHQAAGLDELPRGVH